MRIPLLAVLLPGVSFVSSAEPPRDGVLDPSYGSGGVALHFLADGGNFALRELSDAVLQPDGKLLLIGQVQLVNEPTWWRPLPAIVRLNANGTRDTTFGIDGVSAYPLGFVDGANGGGARSAVVLGDGRIVVAGGIVSQNVGAPTYQRCLLVYALDTLGALIPDYGPGPGPACTDFGASGTLQDVTLLTGGITAAGGGKVYVAGPATPASPRPSVIARLDSAGRFDNSYSSDGRVWLDGEIGLEGYSTPVLATQGDGALYVAARQVRSGLPSRVGVLKLAGSGDVDTAFGEQGFAGEAFDAEIVLQSGLAVDGAGAPALLAYERTFSSASPPDNCNFCVARFDSSGQLDSGFNATGVHPGMPGVARISVNNVEDNSAGFSVRLRPDDRILMAGISGKVLDSGHQATVVSLLPDGNFDPRFGPSQSPGRLTLFPAGGPEIDQVAVVALPLGDGRVLVAGYYRSIPQSNKVVPMFTLRLQDDALLADGFEAP